MSSREIAELTGKEHKHVLFDIRSMLEQLEISTAEFSAVYLSDNGQHYQCFQLPKRETRRGLTASMGFPLEQLGITSPEFSGHIPPLGEYLDLMILSRRCDQVCAHLFRRHESGANGIPA